MLKPAVKILLLWAVLFSVAGATESIQVQALFRDMAVLQFQGQTVTLKKGQAGPDGLQLLSSDSYEAVIEHNGERRRYTLGAQPVTTTYQAPPVRSWQIRPDKRGLYHTAGSVNGRNVNFLVDTGASMLAMNTQHAENIGIDFHKTGRPIHVETASGEGSGILVTLASVRVGSIEIRDVQAVVLEGAYPTEVLLGMTFLDRVHLERKDGLMVLTDKQP